MRVGLIGDEGNREGEVQACVLDLIGNDGREGGREGAGVLCIERGKGFGVG